MSIHPLSPDAARLLRASAVIISPASLVKELVDNAIDAKCTSIRVQISRNTIDLIEVRDNGNGIHSGDFHALGRRAHTSKLRTFQELPHVGATSLGFRGEALACAYTCSEVLIITKTAQDSVGHCLRLNPQGGGISELRTASTAVGSTVQITRLFANLPVRKQMALKTSQKALSDIRHLLQVYAFARPHIRILFKVPSDNKGSWSYSPGIPSTVQEVALQTFGKNLVNKCQFVKATESASCQNKRLVAELTASEISQIEVEGFLPRKDADLSEICRKGAFISVDARPLVSSRGTPKKILATYKRYLETCQGNRVQRLTSPFIQLNIRCPPGTYDVNVSPAKDEVVFTDEPRVLKVVEELFQSCYAAEENVKSPVTAGHDLSSEDIIALESFAEDDDKLSELIEPLNTNSSGPRPSKDTANENGQKGDADALGVSPAHACLAWAVDMSLDLDDDTDEENSMAHNVQRLSVIDQLRRGSAQEGKDVGRASSASPGNGLDTNGRQSLIGGPKASVEQSAHSPTQQTSTVNPWGIACVSTEVKQHEIDTDSTDLGFRPASVENPICADPAQTVGAFPFKTRDFHADVIGDFSGYEHLTPPPMPRSLQGHQKLQTPPSSARRAGSGNRGFSKPFKLPSMSRPKDRYPNGRGKERYGEPRTQHQPAGRGHKNPSLDTAFSYPLPITELVGWPTLLEPTILGLPDHFLTPEPNPSQLVDNDTSPGGRARSPSLMASMKRGRSSIAQSASDPIKEEDPVGPSTAPDIRDFLMQRQRSMSRDKKDGKRALRRVRSNLLPLESVELGKEVHTVMVRETINIDILQQQVSKMMGIDSYVASGKCQLGLPNDLASATDIQNTVQRIFGEWTEFQTGNWCDLKLDLRSQLKGKSREYMATP